MIVKKIEPKEGVTPSFSGLANYITDEQGKDNRVGNVVIHNCVDNDDFDIALIDIDRVQKKNIDPRVKNKTLHLLLSFDKEDRIPTDKEREQIESRFLKALGYEGCQYISVAHHDTDNYHIHLAINRVDPVTYRMHKEVIGDEKIMAKIAVEIEKEFNLKQTNHEPEKNKSQNRVDDMESFTGIESFVSYIKDRKIVIDRSESWNELHKNLNKIGVGIKKKGNGLIFFSLDGKHNCKASTVNRTYSLKNLESRLGAFYEAGLNAANTRTIVNYRKKPLVKSNTANILYVEYIQERKKRKKAYQEVSKNLDDLYHGNDFTYQLLKLSGDDPETIDFVMQYLKLMNSLTIAGEKARKKKIKDSSSITYRDFLKRKSYEGDSRAQQVLEQSKPVKDIIPVPYFELNKVLTYGIVDSVSGSGVKSIIYKEFCYRVNSRNYLIAKTRMHGIKEGQIKQHGITINQRVLARAQSAFKNILQQCADRAVNVGAIITNIREMCLHGVQKRNVADAPEAASQVLLQPDVSDNIRQHGQEPDDRAVRRNDTGLADSSGSKRKPGGGRK